jgi:hypothetical protein
LVVPRRHGHSIFHRYVLEEVLRSTLLINDDDHPYTLDAKAKLAAVLRANGDEPAAAKLEKEIAASKAPAGDE